MPSKLGINFIFFLLCFTRLTYVWASASSCVGFFNSENTYIDSPYLKKTIKRIELLDPDLHAQILQKPEINALSVYLTLKEKAWEYMPHGLLNWKKPILIPEDLRRSWIVNFGHLYKIEQLKPNELGIFYLNSLQSIYSYLAHYVYIELLPIESLRSKNHKAHNFLVLLLESYLMYDLKNSALDPEIVKTFPDTNYQQINWSDLEKLALKYTQNNLTFEQLSKEPEFSVLAREEKQLLEKTVLAFENPKKGCCKTSVGCIFCPNNLGFRLDQP